MTARRVVVVTGGGAGIGAAIAEELGRRGDFVFTMDPLVTLDGTEQLPPPEETTAGRIVAAGGSARASSVSVTDTDGVLHALFDGLREEFGRFDAVVNVAGITRPTSFASGSEDDWRSVLEVHLDGYRNVLAAALPIMATAGHGRVLGVTSGSGWRAADAGAYSCAKRAVASLTWQLGRHPPPGVVVNAISPIAVTRMVTAALERMQAASGSSSSGSGAATGGLALGSMPAPADLGPLGARLVADDFSWCTGKVIFAGGSEIALVDEPRLLEAVRADDVRSLARVVETVSAGALSPAEANQGSGGGSDPRFPVLFDEAPGALPPSQVRTCIVTDRPDVGNAVTSALDARGVAGHVIDASGIAAGFGVAADALARAVESAGPVDAVVVALGGSRTASETATEWQGVLADHAGIVKGVHADAAWARAVADHASRADRPIRLVTLTDAVNAGGRSRARAAAQLARAARKTTRDQVAAFAVSVEAEGGPVGELTAHLVCSPDAMGLAGAELVSGGAWFGIRSHPRVSGSITYGGPDLPDWFDDTLRMLVGEEAT